MIIHKEGHLVSNLRLSGNCKNCGCLFECQSFEATSEFNRKKQEFFYTKSCPHSGCGKIVNLNIVDHQDPDPFDIPF